METNDCTKTASELLAGSEPRPREFISGIAPLNGYCFFRRDKTPPRSEGGIELVHDGHEASVNATCVAAASDAPVKAGDRCVIAFRNVREIWHHNEKVCVMKHDDILAVLES